MVLLCFYGKQVSISSMLKKVFIVIIKKFAECLSQQELLTSYFAGADHKAGCI